jgi:tungstate transport system substrate-binding protein
VKKLALFAVILAGGIFLWSNLHRAVGPSGGRQLRLATTTSVADSGLLAVLAPAFEKRSGYRLEVQSPGSGKAIELLRDGAVDVAITHAPEAEARALEAGEIGSRNVFMQNEFVIVGPKDKIAVVAGATSAADALQRIAASGSAFISRGDESGTNQLEQKLWRSAGMAPNESFIVSAHAGMGATLERASKQKAFTVSDRSTFLARRKDLDLVIVFQGDPALRNHYSVLVPEAHRKVNADGARALSLFVRSQAGRAVIGSYGIERFGESLFTPEQ